jgi:hypothetical protein
MHSNPDSTQFVFENVDIVVAGADSTQLSSRLVAKARQPPGGAVRALGDLPGIIVLEEIVLHHFVPVGSRQAEADGAKHIVHDLADVLPYVFGRGVCKNGFITAPDVVTDARITPPIGTP